MGTPVSKEELAAIQKATDDRWAQATERYKKAGPDAEKECRRICEYMKRTGLECARHIFAAAMMKLHVDLTIEAGKLLGPFEEDEEIDPSVN